MRWGDTSRIAQTPSPLTPAVHLLCEEPWGRIEETEGIFIRVIIQSHGVDLMSYDVGFGYFEQVRSMLNLVYAKAKDFKDLSPEQEPVRNTRRIES